MPAVSLSIKKGTVVTEQQAAYQEAMLKDPTKYFGDVINELPKRQRGLEALE